MIFLMCASMMYTCKVCLWDEKCSLFYFYLWDLPPVAFLNLLIISVIVYGCDVWIFYMCEHVIQE